MSQKTILYHPEVAKEEHEDVTNPPTKRGLMYGWDSDNLEKKRIAVTSDGKLKLS